MTPNRTSGTAANGVTTIHDKINRINHMTEILKRKMHIQRTLAVNMLTTSKSLCMQLFACVNITYKFECIWLHQIQIRRSSPSDDGIGHQEQNGL